MRVVSLHPDVLIATSAVWQTNCVTLRSGEEVFVVDSPILPEELDALPSLLAQAGWPEPCGLLVTHADWDHMLARLAFPGAAMGCAASTVDRLTAEPGAVQRDLKVFDERHYVVRPRPLALGSLQGIEVPGRCDLGHRELELHAAGGHTRDGMAIYAAWAGVLLVGDYLSEVEIPMLGEGGSVEAYLETLARLGPLVRASRHVVPGHGPVLNGERALEILEEDSAYLTALCKDAHMAPLPPARSGRAQKAIHTANVAALGSLP